VIVGSDDLVVQPPAQLANLGLEAAYLVGQRLVRLDLALKDGRHLSLMREEERYQRKHHHQAKAR
jgi:hypothetical protein